MSIETTPTTTETNNSVVSVSDFLLEQLKSTPTLKTTVFDGIRYDRVSIDEHVSIFSVFDGTQFPVVKFVSENKSNGLVAKIGLTDTGINFTSVVEVDVQCVLEDTAVGMDTDIVILGINNNAPIKAKIDTGADICSLHATDITHNDKSVSFTINSRSYTVKLHKLITIARAGDEQQRPTVLLDIALNDAKYSNVEVNLSDRSGLDTPFLLGKNLIELANIVIDPSIKECITFNMESAYSQWGNIHEC